MLQNSLPLSEVIDLGQPCLAIISSKSNCATVSASLLDTTKASGHPENWSTITKMCVFPYSLSGSGAVVSIPTHSKGYWGMEASCIRAICSLIFLTLQWSQRFRCSMTSLYMPGQ